MWAVLVLDHVLHGTKHLYVYVYVYILLVYVH